MMQYHKMMGRQPCNVSVTREKYKLTGLTKKELGVTGPVSVHSRVSGFVHIKFDTHKLLFASSLVVSLVQRMENKSNLILSGGSAS